MKSLTLIIVLSYLLNLPVSYAEQISDVDSKTVEYSQAELEQMLAPIALYPDSVLTHILIAATYPLEVIEAERWVSKNSNSSNTELMDKGEEMEWDPSVVALLPFAGILTKMSTELTWTRQLGDAFLSNEEQVLASIQSLRQKADNAGSLAQMENVDVARDDNNIAITPADPQIVYVPYYDARVVYGPWYWSGYPPVYWAHYPSYYSPHYAAYPAPFYWHTAVHISVGWFFGGFHWGNHHVVVNHHPHSYYYRHYNNHHHGHNSHYSGGKKHYSSGKQHSSKQSSTGYQRWQHQPSHRKSISYKNDRVAKQYSSNKPSKNQAYVTRKQDRKLLALNAYKGSQNGRNNKALKTNKVTSTRHKQIKQQLDKSNVRKNQYKKSSNAVANNSSKAISKNFSAKPNRASINKSYDNKSNRQINNSSSQKSKQVASKSPYTATKSTNKQSSKQYKPKASKPNYSSAKQHFRPSKATSHKSSRKSSSRPKH
ncbi:DUF3300 domain-containing protein [Thalassotalea psychrophila]|uniref:DUF3300 domain-containing protein n=1 Tax=Thalassotalea psychrophila TaxID=3065647 RepID=A0ABY9TXD8_9GAMM|nr:DUF3300 domain-containing protein [Colwelliaceae bacterium SQ149]